MQCPIRQTESADILLDYCAHRLNPEGVAVLERHLQNCHACRQFAADQRLLWSELDQWQPAVISEDFDRKLYGKIDEHQRKSVWRRLFASLGQLAEGKPAVSLAAACLMIVIGIAFHSPEKSSPVPPQESSRAEMLEPEQVERSLEDLEMLKQLSSISGSTRL